MTYTIVVERLMVDADSKEEARELATEYFKDKDFQVRFSEVHEGDLDRDDIRQGRIDV